MTLRFQQFDNLAMGQCRDGVQTFDTLDLVSDRFGSEMINCETYHEVRRFNRELKLTPAQFAAKSVLNIKTIRKGLDKPRYEPLSKGSKLVLIRPPLAGFDSTADTRRLPRSQCTVFAKGRVENSIAYIQKNFLNGLQISCLEALNAQARRWMEQVPSVRVHRESLAQLVQCSSAVEEQVVPYSPTHFWRPTTTAATEPELDIKGGNLA